MKNDKVKNSITILAAALGLTIFMTSIVFESINKNGNIASASEGSTLHIEPITLAKLNFEGLTLQQKQNLIKNYEISADDFLKTGQFLKAEHIATVILISDPNNAKALEVLAKSYFNRTEYKKAELVFRNCIKVSNSNPNNELFLGVSLLRQKKYQDSLILFEKLLKMYPTDGNLNYYSAFANCALGKTEQAILLLEKSHKKLGRNILPLLNDSIFDKVKSDQRFQKMLQTASLKNLDSHAEL